MAFFGLEISNQSGRPVSLYTFTWGTTVWRYTDADRDYAYPPGTQNIFKAVAISDEGVTQGGSATEFTVTLPANLPIIELFRSTPPALPVVLRVQRSHVADPEANTAWIGTVGNVKRKTRAEAEVIGLPKNARRTGLRLCWERSCPHMLYDQDCRANRDTFKTVTTITALTGDRITVASLGAWTGPLYQGGFFEWTPAGVTAGTIERRGIEKHTIGNQFSVFGSTDRIAVNMAVTLYLGCDLTPETCNTVFNNLQNHGGFKFMPGKSPFDGNPVF